MKTLTFIILSLLFLSCENYNETSSNDTASASVLKNASDSIKENLKVLEPTDPNRLKHNLPVSNYYYDIEISKIDCKTIKNAFKVRSEKYSSSTNIDGIIISIKYKMTNPYDKKMMVPIPDYYYITSGSFDAGTEGTTNHRTCHCYIDNGTTLTYKGKEMYQIYDERIDNNYCLAFKPNETKEFKVVFDEPRPSTLEYITFIGFDENKGGTTNATELGVNINLKTKK